jgi:hypothetical protein
MQEQHLYEYAVIRVLPVVEREEFLNAGIIMFCKKANFISVLFSLEKINSHLLSQQLDPEQLQLNLKAFEMIANGDPDGGPIARLDLPSRFRWLTAVRSSAIQTSRPHPGLCRDLKQTAQRLFEELVL